MIRTFLAWLWNSLARSGPEAVAANDLPEWRERQLLRPTATLLVAGAPVNRALRRRILARLHLCDCDQVEGKHRKAGKYEKACPRLAPRYAPRSPIQLKIDKGVRNAVELGFRKYDRLSTKTPAPAIPRAA
jgi:hypothetical protein